MSQSSATTPDVAQAHGHEHDHGHHSPNLQHHFATFEQQFDAAKIGMWLFLATEILLFGGLFVGYGLMQAKYPAAFVEAHHHLDKNLGFLNTVVLLCSSYTMVMAVHAAKMGEKSKLVRNLILTLICAAIFLVVKYFEYSHKIHDGLLPGMWYKYPIDPALKDGARTFFSFYFMMTGLHGFHILGGMVAIGWVLVRAMKGDFTGEWYTPVDLAGLYWHLVDLIWIYLFPLLYLIS